MKQSEMLTMLLGPLLDEFGAARAASAITKAQPIMEAMGNLLKERGDDAAARVTLDAIRVVELWCKGIREVDSKVGAEKKG